MSQGSKALNLLPIASSQLHTMSLKQAIAANIQKQAEMPLVRDSKVAVAGTRFPPDFFKFAATSADLLAEVLHNERQSRSSIALL